MKLLLGVLGIVVATYAILYVILIVAGVIDPFVPYYRDKEEERNDG